MLTFYHGTSCLPTGKRVKNHIDFVRRNHNRIVSIAVYEESMYSMFEDEFARGSVSAMIVIRMDDGTEAYMTYADPGLARLFASFYFEHDYGDKFANGKRFDYYTAAALDRAIRNGTRKRRRKLLSNQ